MIFGWQHLTPEEEDRIARGIAENRVYGGPWHVELQPTNRCNVDCFFCSSRPSRHDESLSWDRLQEVLRGGMEHDLRFVRLSGGGESLIYAKIAPLLDFCGEHGLRLVDITTNGTTLKSHAQRIVDAGTDVVWISLNEPTQEQWASTMQSDQRLFGRILEGAEALIEARNAVPAEKRTKLKLKFLLWKGNCNLLREFVELGKRLQADEIFINSLFECEIKQDFRLSPEQCEQAKPVIRELLEEDFAGERRLLFDLQREGDLQETVWREMSRLNGELAAGEAAQQAAGKLRHEYCYMGWFSATIAATGSVYPCCNFVGMPGKTTGSIVEHSLDQVWRGAGFQRFRDEVRKLVLANGDLEHSRKMHRYLEPWCIACDQCPYTFGLASPAFYARACRELHDQAGQLERLQSAAQNKLLRMAHRVKSAVQSSAQTSQDTP